VRFITAACRGTILARTRRARRENGKERESETNIEGRIPAVGARGTPNEMASPDCGPRNFKEVPRRVSLLGADGPINVRKFRPLSRR